MKKTAFSIGILALPALIFSGCCSGIDKKQTNAAWVSGNPSGALVHYKDYVIEPDDADRLCLYLDRGTFALAAGKSKESCKDFKAAEDVIGGLDSGPVISISDMIEGPYKGTNMERIMLGVTHALALMESGDFDNAGAILRKTKIYQDNAASAYESAIAKENERIKKSENRKEGRIDPTAALKELPKGALDAKEVEPQPGFDVVNARKYLTEDQVNSLKRYATENAAAGAFTNPYAYWLAGIYFLYTAENVNERSEAAKLLEKAVASNSAKSSLMLKDYAYAEKVADGAALVPATYIINESGAISKRGYDDYVIPVAFISAYINALFEASGSKLSDTPLPNMTIRIPKLVPAGWPAPAPLPIAGVKAESYETLVDLDWMKAAEFAETRDSEILSNVISASILCAARFVAQEIAAQNAGDYGSLIGLASFVATPAVPVEMRGWELLPQKISVVKIATPEAGTLKVGKQDVKLKKSGINIVRVRNVAGKPLVNVVSFGK